MTKNKNDLLSEQEFAEELGEGIIVCRSTVHSFGTDAFLLAHFSMPKKGSLVCDLGTGCGIIPMLWAKNGFPKTIWGVDIQKQAVEQFCHSVKLSHTGCELVPLCADLRKLPSKIPFGRFHLVSCNPPYQAEHSGFLSEDPSGQIARHEVLCRMDDVCAAADKLLRFGGKFCVCMRPERLVDTVCSMRAHHIEPKRLRFVCKEAGSAPWLFLLEGCKGAHPFMTVEPQFCLYNNGKYTPEFAEVYR